VRGDAWAKEHYRALEGLHMTAELVIQLLVLIVMIIDLANRSNKE